MIDVAQRLRAAMKAKALSAPAACEMLGIQPNYLRKILCGNRSGYRLLPDLARVLEVPLEWLTTGRGPAPAWYDLAAASAAGLASGPHDPDPTTDLLGRRVSDRPQPAYTPDPPQLIPTLVALTEAIRAMAVSQTDCAARLARMEAEILALDAALRTPGSTPASNTPSRHAAGS